MSPALVNLVRVLARVAARIAYQIGFVAAAEEVEDALLEWEDEQ